MISLSLIACLVIGVSANAVNNPLVGGNPCTWGPSYWCSTASAANTCGALEYCQSKGLFLDAPATSAVHKREIMGSNKCTWGPSYWCSNANAASTCGALEYCQSKGMLLNEPVVAVHKREIVGSNKCTWGPSYWCSDINAANTCGTLEYCQSKGLLLNETVPAVQKRAIVGGDKCTWGPSYWCSDINAANACNTLEYCQSQGLLLSNTEKPSPVECKICQLTVSNAVKNLTSNSTVTEIEDALINICAKLGGFAAVCSDFVDKYTPELIAVISQDLNATRVCIKLGFCSNTTTTGSVAPPASAAPASDSLPLAVQDTLTFGGNIGSNACTEGPAYWCSSMNTANMCDAVSYCTKNNWAKTGIPK